MYIDKLIWLPEIVDKLHSKHGVVSGEVEEVLSSDVRFRFHEKGRVAGEDMYTALGQTHSGRYLIVFFLRKSANRALIISARDMSPSERRRYGRK